jgi:hypothetical protein
VSCWLGPKGLPYASIEQNANRYSSCFERILGIAHAF